MHIGLANRCATPTNEYTECGVLRLLSQPKRLSMTVIPQRISAFSHDRSHEEPYRNTVQSAPTILPHASIDHCCKSHALALSTSHLTRPRERTGRSTSVTLEGRVLYLYLYLTRHTHESWERERGEASHIMSSVLQIKLQSPHSETTVEPITKSHRAQ